MDRLDKLGDKKGDGLQPLRPLQPLQSLQPVQQGSSLQPSQSLQPVKSPLHGTKLSPRSPLHSGIQPTQPIQPLNSLQPASLGQSMLRPVQPLRSPQPLRSHALTTQEPDVLSDPDHISDDFVEKGAVCDSSPVYALDTADRVKPADLAEHTGKPAERNVAPFHQKSEETKSTDILNATGIQVETDPSKVGNVPTSHVWS
jgi:hypothetical protein